MEIHARETELIALCHRTSILYALVGMSGTVHCNQFLFLQLFSHRIRILVVCIVALFNFVDAFIVSAQSERSTNPKPRVWL
jgi:hypothetical protein